MQAEPKAARAATIAMTATAMNAATHHNTTTADIAPLPLTPIRAKIGANLGARNTLALRPHAINKQFQRGTAPTCTWRLGPLGSHARHFGV